MALDDVGLRIEVEAPDRFQEHGARHHLAGMADKLFEQRELARLEVDLAALAAGFAAQQIEADRAVPDPCRR